MTKKQQTSNTIPSSMIYSINDNNSTSVLVTLQLNLFLPESINRCLETHIQSVTHVSSKLFMSLDCQELIYCGFATCLISEIMKIGMALELGRAI